MTITLGSALRNNCRKGQNCNFLHIFKNPSELFSIERTLREPSNVMNSQRRQMAQNDIKDEYVSVLLLLCKQLIYLFMYETCVPFSIAQLEFQWRKK